MSLNPDIKKLCDKNLEKLFSLKDWKKIKNKNFIHSYLGKIYK